MWMHECFASFKEISDEWHFFFLYKFDPVLTSEKYSNEKSFSNVLTSAVCTWNIWLEKYFILLDRFKSIFMCKLLKRLMTVSHHYIQSFQWFWRIFAHQIGLLIKGQSSYFIKMLCSLLKEIKALKQQIYVYELYTLCTCVGPDKAGANISHIRSVLSPSAWWSKAAKCITKWTLFRSCPPLSPFPVSCFSAFNAEIKANSRVTSGSVS